MTASPARTLCLAALMLAIAGCARSESTQGASDSLGQAIAQRDNDQAAATIGREADAREAAVAEEVRRAEQMRRKSAN